MISEYKPLPIGVDNFEDLIKNNYYYVDKTLMIKELLDKKGEVTLFIRPRRFGKTLNMSMLQCFFENRQDNRVLYQGMKIMEAGDSYLAHMGKYPVIAISLKSLKQPTYTLAYEQLKREIKRACDAYRDVLPGSDALSLSEKKRYEKMTDLEGEEADYVTVIQFLSECLYRHYGEKAIILIDEYDVPLENAYFSGFYDQMVGLIRSLFESGLKTNQKLFFAVITGCLRISRKSIFTGINNLKIISITNPTYAEHFGFTQMEVEQMMDFYDIRKNQATMKQWYDGYLFGDTEVYNPWSVINYVEASYWKPDNLPSPYWSNTSSNSIVRRLVERADLSVKREIEALIEGQTIVKPVHEDITYEDIDSSQDNLWNFLFFTGYLKKIREWQEEEIRYIEMAIPNSEVRYIYKTTVRRWFEEQIASRELSDLYRHIVEGDTAEIADILCENLMETISFYDYQESFYHGFLVGMLKNIGNYIVLSNREAGCGRPDILLKYPSVRGKAIIFELKVAKTYREMAAKCEEALRQIEEQHYEDNLRHEGYRQIMKYGIAFYRKECMVKLGR